MLTQRPRNAPLIADRSPRRPPALLSAHRRFELLVALLVLVAAVIVVVDAEPASAQAPSFEAGAAEAEGSAGFETSPATPTGDEDVETRAAAAPRIAEVRTTPERIFLGSRRRAAFGFELAGGRGRELLVKVVGVETRTVVRRFRLGRVPGGERARVSWDGKLPRGGYADEGLYAFRVFSGGDRADVKGNPSSGRFGFYGHRFPLLGRHDYGDGFGAGRGHQGQDLLASCGTRVVAARGGRVQTRAYHEGAGYYVVVDGRGTGQDLRHADRDHGEDETRRAEEAADEDELDEPAKRDSRGQADRQGEEVGHAGVEDEQHRQRRRQTAQIALREVDDAVRPVDQRDPEGDEGGQATDDDALQQYAGRHP